MVTGPNDVRRFDDPYAARGAGERFGGTETRERSSEEIRAEIDRTRAEMDHTVDEIQHRLTPEQIMQRALISCQHAAGEGARKLFNVVKENPLPSAVIGAGIAMLFLRKSHDGSSPARSASYSASRYDVDAEFDPYYVSPTGQARETGRVRRAVSNAKEKTSEIAEGVKEKASEFAQGAAGRVKDFSSQARERVRDASGAVAGSVRSASSYVSEKAGALGHTVQDSARHSVQWADEMIHEYPLAAGAAFFTLGLAGGLVVPTSRKEDEILGTARDKLMHQAQAAGAELLHKGEQMAEKAAGAVKSAVQTHAGTGASTSASATTRKSASPSGGSGATPMSFGGTTDVGSSSSSARQSGPTPGSTAARKQQSNKGDTDSAYPI